MRRYLIFAIVSPLLGGFLLLVTTTVMSGYWDGPPRVMEVFKLLKVFVSTIQYSYLFGILPALMLGAVDDIFFHIKRIGPVLRMLLLGVVGFVAAELIYGSRGADTGVLQFVLYGLVGFVPGFVGSLLAHCLVGPQHPAPVSSPAT